MIEDHYAPIPSDLIIAVIYDDARYTPEGTTFSILEAVRVFHGLPIEDAKRDLIWPLIRKHDRRLKAKRRKATKKDEDSA